MPAYASWLGDQIDAAGIDHAHLVMHDFGGAFGLVWAAAHPDRIASLTLIDTGVLIDYRWHVLARIWRTPDPRRAVQRRDQPLRVRRRCCAAASPGRCRASSWTSCSRISGHSTRKTVLRLYRNTDESQLALLGDHFRALDPPTLVLWGAHDAYLPVAQAVRQREVFPSARVVVLPDSGHWPQGDDPDAVESNLVPFLRKAAARCAKKTAHS